MRLTRRRALLAAGVALLLLVLALLRLYVVPPSDPVGSADGIVVLGPGYLLAPLETAARLKTANPSAEVLVSAPDQRYCPRVNGRSIVTCFRPEPFTTQGEARYAAAYARAHGWRTIAVVAPAYQVSRARLRLRRCWSGGLRIVASPTGVGQRLQAVPYEAAATVKALVLQRDC